jgi:hypothetical protein
MFSRLFRKSALTALFEKEHLDNLRVLVVERVKMFHYWLNEQHGVGKSLTGLDLDKFTDNVMANLVEAHSRKGGMRAHESSSSKASGLTLPMFNGNQSQYKVWNQKWRAYLGTIGQSSFSCFCQECSLLSTKDLFGVWRQWPKSIV